MTAAPFEKADLNVITALAGGITSVVATVNLTNGPVTVTGKGSSVITGGRTVGEATRIATAEALTTAREILAAATEAVAEDDERHANA